MQAVSTLKGLVNALYPARTDPEPILDEPGIPLALYQVDPPSSRRMLLVKDALAGTVRLGLR